MSEPRTPTGPRGVPVLGILPSIVRTRSLATSLSDYWLRYGDVFQARVGTTTTVFFARPEAVQRILVDNRDNYLRSRFQLTGALKMLIGEGLLTTEGAHWRRQRHFMQAPLAVSAMKAYAPIMIDATGDLLAEWDERVRAGAVEVVMYQETASLALNVLGRAVLGFDTRADAVEVGQMVNQMVKFMSGRLWGLVPLWLPTPGSRQLQHNLRRLDQMLDRIIRVRRAAPDTYGYDADLVSHVLRARDEWGEGMLERELHSELLTLYLAGHEISAQLLCAIFYALAREPLVQDRVHAELDAVLEGRTPSLADLDRLPYTCRVVDESLRLYPPLPFLNKESRQDDVVDGYRVRRGTTVVVSPFITQRHPEVWPDPERFDPDRHTPAQSAGRHRLAMFPFSAGYHACIGASFALQEVRLAVAAISSRYRFEPLASSTRATGVREFLGLRNVRLRLVPLGEAGAYKCKPYAINA